MLSPQQIRQQFVTQTTLYNRLKKWLANTMILSSFFISLALFFRSVPWVVWPAWILFACSVAAVLTIGLALKRGKDNLDKLLLLLNQEA